MDCILCDLASGMTDGTSRMTPTWADQEHTLQSTCDLSSEMWSTGVRGWPRPIVASNPIVGRAVTGNAGMPQEQGREAGSLAQRGPAPGSRGGGSTVAHAQSVPVPRSGGLWSTGIKPFAPQHPAGSGDRSPRAIGPADYGRVTQNSNWRKTMVKIAWLIPGGPACTAEHQPHGGAYLHIQRYPTIDDFRRPTLALPSHNMAAIDAPTLFEQARARILSTLYPQKKAF